MPRPHERTRSKKREKRTLPGGSGKVHYKKEINASLHCRLCGQLLGGISRVSSLRMRKMNRSRKRIWRQYGGQICHNCLKNTLKQAARTA